MTLQEMLQKRAALIEQQKALVEAAKAMNRGLNPEESTKFDELNASIEGLDKLIEAEKRVASLTAALDEPAETVHRPQVVPGLPSQNNQKKDDGGFKSLGEFVNAVRFGDPRGRLQAAVAEQSMGVDTAGGYAVPEQFRDELLAVDLADTVVRRYARIIPAGSPPDAKLSIPALDQAEGTFGGVEVSWIGEGATKPQTEAKLRQVTLEPKEVAGSIDVTDQLLRNWEAAGSVLRELLAGALGLAEDLAFLTGNGVGKPAGVLGATGAIAVNRATANQITFEDVANMVGKMVPSALNRARWVATYSALPQIIAMKDDAGNSIFIRGDATKGIADTLLGYPISWTGNTPALGSKGDLMFVSFPHYLIKDGSGPYIAASEHVKFRQNQTVIKIFRLVDGKPWVTAPLTLGNGVTTVSPYVILDVPAGG